MSHQTVGIELDSRIVAGILRPFRHDKIQTYEQSHRDERNEEQIGGHFLFG